MIFFRLTRARMFESRRQQLRARKLCGVTIQCDYRGSLGGIIRVDEAIHQARGNVTISEFAQDDVRDPVRLNSRIIQECAKRGDRFPVRNVIVMAQREIRLADDEIRDQHLRSAGHRDCITGRFRLFSGNSNQDSYDDRNV